MNIRHSINDGTFPSSAHLSIWYCRQMLARYHDIPVHLEGLDSETIKRGTKDFHDFLCFLYDQMYENPERFLIPVGPYDEYIKSSGKKPGAEKEHFTDTKESKLRNEFQKAIQYYGKFLYELGIRVNSLLGERCEITFSSEVYDEVKNASAIIRKDKSHEKRVEAWRALGIHFLEENGSVRIRSDKFPLMFIGLRLLCQAPESSYKYMNYLRGDFKGCVRTSPGIEDIKETLLPQHAQMIEQLEQALEELPMKVKIQRLRQITSGFQWKAEYHYKGKNIFGFYAEPAYLMFCLYFNDSKKVNQLSQQLMESDQELYLWFQSKFPKRECQCRYNRKVVFGAEARRICGLSSRAEVENPQAGDVEKSIMIMKYKI